LRRVVPHPRLGIDRGDDILFETFRESGVEEKDAQAGVSDVDKLGGRKFFDKGRNECPREHVGNGADVVESFSRVFNSEGPGKLERLIISNR